MGENNKINNGPSIIGGAIKGRDYRRDISIVGDGISKGEFDSYLKARKNSEIGRKAIRKKGKKRILKSTMVAGVFSLVVASHVGIMQVKGNESICNQFHEVTSDYGVHDYSNGYQINKGEQMVSFDTGLSSMVEDAHDAGMNDIDIYIAVEEMFNKDTAEEFVKGDIKLSDKIAARFEAYHESQLEQIKSKGASR